VSVSSEKPKKPPLELVELEVEDEDEDEDDEEELEEEELEEELEEEEVEVELDDEEVEVEVEDELELGARTMFSSQPFRLLPVTKRKMQRSLSRSATLLLWDETVCSGCLILFVIFGSFKQEARTEANRQSL
jgi:hypothetical protein